MAKSKTLHHFFQTIDTANRHQQSFLFALVVPIDRGMELDSLTLDIEIDGNGFKPTDKTKRSNKR